MDDFKDWYKNRKGKYILFFGFYLIFFIFFAFYIKAGKENKKEEPKKIEPTSVEKIASYDITSLINNDYRYEIIINDNEEVITFNGTKNNIDYANYVNKYFLDIYNINQLLKRSKYIENKDNVLLFNLSNSELNDILVTSKNEGSNNIYVYLNDKKEIKEIIMDLSNYLEKEIYKIDINYFIGEENENSSS